MTGKYAPLRRDPFIVMQAGFTLIELIMVIVILGTLAAIAFPRFVDLSSEAENAALEGVAASMGSASAMNYAVRVASGRVKGAPVADCTDVAFLLDGGLPSGYTVNAQAVAPGTTASCSVTQTSTNVQALFIIHGTT
ncbi:MAG: type II secretion system protein [Nitrospinota bacterium]